MKVIKKALEGWRYLLVTPLLFLSYITTSFLHNGFTLLSQEYLASIFVLLVLSSPFGILMIFGGRIIRVLTAAILVFVFILSQIPYKTLFENMLPDNPRAIVAIILLTIFVIAVGIYFIRQHVDKFLLILFGVFLLGSLFTPRNPFIEEKLFDISSNSNNTSLPPYIHIILDGHIGIEGIPHVQDKDNQLANSLKNKYIQNGFRVYGRAYSQYSNTESSFGSFLTFNDGKIGLFEELSVKGYHINVFQSSFLDLCKKNENISLKHCFTYNHYGLSYSLPLIISDTLTRLHIVVIYNRLIMPLMRTALGLRLPGMSVQVTEKPSMSRAAYDAFPVALKLLKNVKMGNAYFVHLLLPHAPFVFNKECSFIRGRTELESQNSYPFYLEQILCVQTLIDQILSNLDENSSAQKSTIIIHGDHGSRIAPTGMISVKEEAASHADRIQLFSTFFALRGPEYKTGYDRSPLSLRHLMNEEVFGKKYNMGDKGNLYIDTATGERIRTFILPFSHGHVSNEW